MSIENLVAQALVQAGVLGPVLVWFMLRAEARLERLERAQDRLTRAQMLTLIARPDVEEPIKHQARILLQEISPVPMQAEQGGYFG